jgi:hypothetical protein
VGIQLGNKLLPNWKLRSNLFRNFSGGTIYFSISLPDEIKSSLPTIEEIEAELGSGE